MNGYELKKLCAPPMRKRADDDTMRKLLFGGAGAGTGALVNHLIGNRSLTSYLLGGGIGAIGGLGLERLLNSDTSKEAQRKQTQIDQIHEIEDTLGRPLTEAERQSFIRYQNGMDYKGTLIGGLAGTGLQAYKTVKNDFKPDEAFHGKKFIEQYGAGGEKLLDNLTDEYIRNNQRNPLVAQYEKAAEKSAARDILREKIRNRVAGANRNYGTRIEPFNKVFRWANSPGGGWGASSGKWVVRNLGGPIGRIGGGAAIGFVADYIRQALATAKARQLMREYRGL